MKNEESLKYHFKKLFFDRVKEAGIDVKNYAIAGGALRDYLVGETIKDIDIFTNSLEAEIAIINFLNNNYEKINENESLANFKVDGRWFQVIKKRYYDLKWDALIKTFDFTICGIMLNGEERLLVLPTFYQDLLAKHLRVNILQFPLSSLERMQKYIKRGYTACNGTLLTLSKAIATVDFNNKDQAALEFYSDGSPRFIGID